MSDKKIVITNKNLKRFQSFVNKKYINVFGRHTNSIISEFRDPKKVAFYWGVLKLFYSSEHNIKIDVQESLTSKEKTYLIFVDLERYDTSAIDLESAWLDAIKVANTVANNKINSDD